MLGFYLARWCCLLIILAAHSRQVDIVIQSQYETVRCPGIQPGLCCAMRYPYEGTRPRRVIFQHLTALDIAAVWGGIHDWEDGVFVVARCSGILKESRRGPGVWTYQEPLNDICGASYITLPQSLPPDRNTIRTLDIEGILGLVWGGGKWFVSPAADRLLAGGGKSVSRNGRRDIRSPEKGTVYARSPRALVYPTFVTINGTEYSNEGMENLIYTDTTTGSILNLTDWFI